MPRPQTLPDLLELIKTTGLIDLSTCATFTDDWERAATRDPQAALDGLVARGLLTQHQADRLAAGETTGYLMGRYRILRPLGTGAVGRVYLASSPEGGLVAVKVLTAHRRDPNARSRFVREARAAAAIGHSDVVQIREAHPDHDPPFLVMDYVDGITLQKAVTNHGPLTPAEAAVVGARVAGALERVAAAGLVHRDVKPANLILDRSGVVRVLDLGLARFAEDDLTRLTGGDYLLGTVDYLAPEQALDSSAVDPRADLYALGATLYFLLLGRPPFPGGLTSARLTLKMTTDPPPVHTVCETVPPELGQVVQRLLAREPNARFQTAAEAADALRPWACPPPGFPARFFAPATTNPVDSWPEPSSGPGTLTVRIRSPRQQKADVPDLPPAPVPDRADSAIPCATPTARPSVPPPIPRPLVASSSSDDSVIDFSLSRLSTGDLALAETNREQLSMILESSHQGLPARSGLLVSARVAIRKALRRLFHRD